MPLDTEIRQCRKCLQRDCKCLLTFRKQLYGQPQQFCLTFCIMWMFLCLSVSVNCPVHQRSSGTVFYWKVPVYNLSVLICTISMGFQCVFIMWGWVMVSAW